MKRILIVEDDEAIADIEKGVLEEEGFKVEVARDGVEGLEKVKQNIYDVIITDCDMPRMNGYALYLEVRNVNLDLAKRIMFASGHITNFIKSTGNRFLLKPFSPHQLLEVVNDFITQ